MLGRAIAVANLSVRLSVKRVHYDKTRQSSVNISTSYDRMIFLVSNFVVLSFEIHPDRYTQSKPHI